MSDVAITFVIALFLIHLIVTLLTLIFIPCLYMIKEDIADLLKKI